MGDCLMREVIRVRQRSSEASELISVHQRPITAMAKHHGHVGERARELRRRRAASCVGLCEGRSAHGEQPAVMLEDGAVTDLLHRGDLYVQEGLAHRLQRLDVRLLAPEQVRLEQSRELTNLWADAPW